MSGQPLKVGVAKHLHPAYVTFYFDDPIVIITDGTNVHPRWTPAGSCDSSSLTRDGNNVFSELETLMLTGADIVEVWTSGPNFVRVTVGNPLHRDDVIAAVARPFVEALGVDVNLVALEGYIS